MTLQDHDWYRAEATRCRERAAETTDSRVLRNSYRELANACDRLAAFLRLANR